MVKYFHNKYIIRIHLALLVVAFILLYWQVLVNLLYSHSRFSVNFSYEFIIPLLSLYMIWSRRDYLKSTPIKPSKSGLLIITAGIIFYIAGQATKVMLAQNLSFILIIPGIVLYYFGSHMLRRLFIPIFILIFMFPYGKLVTSYLQLFYAHTCGKVFHLFNVPVYVDGYYIHLPNIVLEVSSACSGINSMTALIPIGLAIAWLMFNSRWEKIFVAAISFTLPFLTNSLRILSIMVLALKGNDTFLRGSLHYIHGHVFFLVALALLFGFTALLKRISNPKVQEKEKRIVVHKSSDKSLSTGFLSIGNFILIFLVLLTPGLAHLRLLTQQSIPLTKSFNSFPTLLGGWEGQDVGKHQWYPIVVGATDNLRRRYSDRDGNQIKIFVSYLPIQNRNQKLTYYDNRISPEEFKTIEENIKEWTIRANRPLIKLNTKRLILKRGASKKTLFYWYQNANHFAADKYIAKFYMALDSLFQNRSNGAVFVLMYDSLSSSATNHAVKINEFLNQFMPEIAKYIPT